MNKIARSAIKSTDIQAAPERVYAFLVDPYRAAAPAIASGCAGVSIDPLIGALERLGG